MSAVRYAGRALDGPAGPLLIIATVLALVASTVAPVVLALHAIGV